MPTKLPELSDESFFSFFLASLPEVSYNIGVGNRAYIMGSREMKLIGLIFGLAIGASVIGQLLSVLACVFHSLSSVGL